MVAYESFIADIYDSSPFFGQGKARELEMFNAPYFRHLAGRNRRILEFGCGTGMLTVPLARAGYELDSVDISAAMQAVVSRKLAREEAQVSARVNQIIADATTFRTDRPYESIVMPEGILIAIADGDMQLELLRSCHRNLASGGRIFIDFFQPYYRALFEGTVTEHSRFRDEHGQTYLFTIEITNDLHTQLQHWQVTYTPIDEGRAGEPTVVELDFRYVWPSEIKLMLKLTGFEVIELDTDFAGGRGYFLTAEKA